MPQGAQGNTHVVSLGSLGPGVWAGFISLSYGRVSQGVAWTVIISRLTWGRIHFQPRVCCHMGLPSTVACFIQACQLRNKGVAPQRKSHFSNLTKKWHPIIFAVVYWLWASHKIQRTFNGQGLHKGMNTRWQSLGTILAVGLPNSSIKWNINPSLPNWQAFNENPIS